jgi:hypothetical protein
MQPLSFQPERREIDDVPLEVHNKLIEENEGLKNELMRCRQKVAHLLKEVEAGKGIA